MKKLCAHIVMAAVLPVVVGAWLVSCSGGGSAALAPLSERFAIDGVADLASVGTVHEQSIAIRENFGAGPLTVQTSTLRWAVRNDDRNLYIALEWNDTTQNSFDPANGLADAFDGVVLFFDSNSDGVLGQDEDAHRLIMNIYSSVYGDVHVDAVDGTADDIVADGMGRMTWSAGTYQAEFLIPLAADSENQDAGLRGSPLFNIMIYDHVLIYAPSGNVGTLAGPSGIPGVGTDTSAWPFLPYAAPGTYDQPEIPPGLTGLIVFISDHENPKGELYTFDPGTRVVTRVTHTTGLYLDGASLSHDRTKIALFAAPTSTDYANYEIYSVNTAGGSPVSLTTNSILDGHPAWSPDDARIVYVSFREGGKASLVVSSATGTEIADLTPVGMNDNDPDWLPDGRIVFKTDRFGAPGSPEVRIAVMGSDGTAVTQLTGSNGTSDHVRPLRAMWPCSNASPRARTIRLIRPRSIRHGTLSRRPWTEAASGR